MVHSYYASHMPSNNNEKKFTKFATRDERDVSILLSQHLDREIKRISSGLAKLGMFLIIIDTPNSAFIF